MESREKNRTLPLTSLPGRATRAAIVGAGYIAEFHASAIRALPQVELVAICDANLQRAKSFAAEWAISAAFDSVQAMLGDQCIDVVHVLTPPDLHHSLAKAVLQAGTNVFLEKPMCTSIREADELLEMADAKKLVVGVNHNFLFSEAYRILRRAIYSGTLGPLDDIIINHFHELKPIRLGPFDSWMFRAPGNVLLEIGPHLVSALLDLVGPPETLTVTTDRKVMLPNGSQVIRRWRIHMTAGRTAQDININFGPGFGQWTITAHGLLGSGILDLDANSCIIDHGTALSPDLDRYSRSRSSARQLQQQALKTLTDYALTKVKLRKRGNPYQTSILDSIATFYAGLRSEVGSTAVYLEDLAVRSSTGASGLLNLVMSSLLPRQELPLARRLWPSRRF